MRDLNSYAVGYLNSTNTLGKKYSPVGAMFMKVGATKGTWKLGEIKPKEETLDYNSEYLQEFDPTTGGIGKKYCYVDSTKLTVTPFRRWSDEDKAKAVGWWDYDTIGEFSSAGPGLAVKADDVEFKAGQGLYSNFGNALAKLNFSGEVVCEEWQLDLTGKKYAPIINFLARPISLKEIVPEDECLDYNSEYLQEFNPSTGGIGKKYCYVDSTKLTVTPFRRWSDEDKANAVGWWEYDTISEFTSAGPGKAVKADGVKIEPGAGFYSNFGNAQAVLNFPTSIPAAE